MTSKSGAMCVLCFLFAPPHAQEHRLVPIIGNFLSSRIRAASPSTVGGLALGRAVVFMQIPREKRPRAATFMQVLRSSCRIQRVNEGLVEIIETLPQHLGMYLQA